MTKSFKDLPFFDHLEELRGRIIKSVGGILLASCFFYRFIDQAFLWLTEPVGDLYFIAPTEAFLATITLTLLGGTFLALPFLFYQLWAFVGVALTVTEKRYIYLFGPLSFVCFLVGIAFAYFVVCPFTLKFLLSFSYQNLNPMITVHNYISFIGSFCLAFGVIFEMPLVIIFLTRIGIATPAFLTQMRRQAILLIFILSAFLTPPDYASQVLMALPLIILYEISIILSKITYRLRNQSRYEEIRNV